MKTAAFWSLLLLVLTLAPASASESAVLPGMVGSWRGDARLDRTRTLSVALDIAANGAVTGTIGGATLREGKFQRNRGALGRALNVKTDYIIVGALDGSLVPNDAAPPPRVMIPLTWHDGHFTGTVHGVKA